MSVRKKFDRELYEENDPVKHLAIEFWKSKGFDAEVHPNRYAIDLVIEKGGKRFYCEVECKHTWKGTDFKYPTIQIPERKSKFLGLDSPALFMIFNSEKTHAFLIHEKFVTEDTLKIVPNKFVRYGEKFFQVPVEHAVKVKIQ